MIICDKIINAAGSASANVINTVSKNVTSTASIHFYNKTVRYKMDCAILRTVLLVQKKPTDVLTM